MLAVHRRRLSRAVYSFDVEEHCRHSSRAARAGEGAILGMFVGLVAGVVMGGAARFTLGKDSKIPLKISLGMLGIGIVGGAVVDAVPPKC
jgi:hypothetical protein